jgi:hypothetical protein
MRPSPSLCNFSSFKVHGMHFMKNKSTRICCIVLFLLATSARNSAFASTHIPKHFSAWIGGAMEGYYHLELRKGNLIYTHPNKSAAPKKNITIRPNAQQWREFRQALDDLNVWQWQSNYQSRAFDGTQWALDISYADKKIKSYGDNNYPDAAGKPDNNPGYTASFNQYLEAIRKLTGGKDFR